MLPLAKESVRADLRVRDNGDLLSTLRHLDRLTSTKDFRRAMNSRSLKLRLVDRVQKEPGLLG